MDKMGWLADRRIRRLAWLEFLVHLVEERELNLHRVNQGRPVPASLALTQNEAGRLDPLAVVSDGPINDEQVKRRHSIMVADR